MHEVLTKIQEDMAETRTTQAVMQRDLAHHIRRTELAEESIDLVRADVIPIKKHVHMVEGALKLIGVLGVLMGIAGTVYTVVSG